MSHYLTDSKFKILEETEIQESFNKMKPENQAAVLTAFDLMIENTNDGEKTDFFYIPYTDEDGKTLVYRINQMVVLKDKDGKVDIFRGGILEDVEVVGNKTKKTESAKNVDLPRFTYDDFMQCRTNWVKGASNIRGERGYFYFKIFFKFRTNKGLFGSILDLSLPLDNSAISYLLEINNGYYNKQLVEDKAVALIKFVKMLSFINSTSPWFFESVNGLGDANVFDFSKSVLDKTIEIGCTPDSIDMRISHLMDLYKFACFDLVNRREILTDNLRKFDMSILIFNSPIKYYHTEFKKGSQLYKNKSSDDENFNNRFSYKLFSFKNCEFLLDEFKTYYANEMTSKDSFQSGKATLKIKYDRVYQHSLDEWTQIMWGDEGIVWSQYSTPLTNEKTAAAVNQGDASQSATSREKQLEGTDKKWNVVETAENIIRYNMEEYTDLGTLWDLGNLYSGYSLNDQIYDLGSTWSRIKNIGNTIKNNVSKAKANLNATIESVKSFKDVFDSGTSNSGTSVGKFFLGELAVYEDGLRRMRQQTTAVPKNELLKLQFQKMYPKKNLGNLYK